MRSQGPSHRVKKHLGLCWEIPKRYMARKGVDYDPDEYVGACYIALLKADRAFDSSRSQSFENYARWRLWNAIIDELRSKRAGDPVSRYQYGKIHVASLDEPVRAHSPTSFAETIPADTPDPADVVETVAQIDHCIAWVWRHLKPNERAIVSRRYFEGHTQEEIARDLFVTGSRVSQIERRARARLREFPNKPLTGDR